MASTDSSASRRPDRLRTLLGRLLGQGVDLGGAGFRSCQGNAPPAPRARPRDRTGRSRWRAAGCLGVVPRAERLPAIGDHHRLRARRRGRRGRRCAPARGSAASVISGACENSSRFMCGTRSERWMTVVPLAWMPMPMPEPESRAAVSPRKDVSAVCPMRTTRADIPASAMPCSIASSTCDSGTSPVVWKILARKAGLRPITTSGALPSPASAGPRGTNTTRRRSSPAQRAWLVSTSSRPTDSAHGDDLGPPLGRQPVPGARAGIDVRVIDGADHLAVDGRWPPSADSRPTPAAAPSRPGSRASAAKPRVARARITSAMVSPRSRTASFMAPTSPSVKVSVSSEPCA